MRPIPEEIRRAGLAALRRELGKAGMIRFILQFSNGHGDYAKERRAWVDQTSLDEIFEAADRRQRAAAASTIPPKPATKPKSPPTKRVARNRKHVEAVK